MIEGACIGPLRPSVAGANVARTWREHGLAAMRKTVWAVAPVQRTFTSLYDLLSFAGPKKHAQQLLNVRWLEYNSHR
jgi:hypothetical protein